MNSTTTAAGKIKLNLGCGNRKRAGFVNVDSQPGCAPDTVVDLERMPWPWPDDAADEVDLIHVLEHLGQAPERYLAIMRELWRVCCDGALVRIVVPHPRSDEFLNDPTHVRPVTEAGLEMFCQRLNAEWAAIGAANTPLGKYLGIDFEIESSMLDLKPWWRQRFESGQASEEEIRHAGNHQYNVFSQITVLLRAVKPAGRLIGAPAAAAAPAPSTAPVPDDWHARTATALEGGNLPEALAVVAAAVAADPADMEALAHLATLQHAAGQLDDALRNFQTVARSDTCGLELYNNYGVVALELGRGAEAATAFERALTFDTGNRTVRANLAEALGEAGRIQEAVAHYEALLREDGGAPETCLGIARLFLAQGWFADALSVLDMGLAGAPDDVELLNQKGIALRETGRFAEALAVFEGALARVPGNEPLSINRAAALARLGRDDEAETVFREALARAGDTPSYELGFAFACFLLKRGRCDEGWRHYETRRLSSAVARHPLEASVPQWRGEAVDAGARLLVVAEQGYGDNIQFLRLLPRIVDRFAQVVLHTRPPLKALFARSLQGICEVVDELPAGAAFDRFCPLASLPAALSLPVEQWGMAAPYLKPDPMQSALWGFRIPAGGRRKIGLCRAGGKAARFRHRCDLPLEVAERLLAVAGIAWISLQKEGDDAWRQQMVQAGRLIDLMGVANSFDDTAALIGNLDLVITVDTSVAHVAGALGKPVWLLLDADADWRWLRDGETSPWYPSMRLFRQPAPGDWVAVGERVVAELATPSV